MNDDERTKRDEIEGLRAENEALRAVIERMRVESAASALDPQRTQFFGVALTEAPVAFSSGTSDGRLYYANRAFMELTGYTPDEFARLRSWVLDITPPRFHEYEGRYVQTFFETRVPQIYEKAYLRKDGTEIPVEVWLNATYTTTGEIDMLYVFATDIRERKRHLSVLEDHRQHLEAAVKERTTELEAKIETIDRQREQLAALSVPVLKLWQGVLVLPVVGHVDATRASLITEELLTRISTDQARWVIIDLTGVALIDGTTASQFGAIMRSVELMGTECVLSGIRPAVARTMIEIGTDLQRSLTFGNLEAALRHCMKRLDRS